MGLRRDLKEITNPASLFSSGNAFQSRGALMAKPRPPLVFSLDFGTVRRAPSEDLRLRAGS